MHSAEIGGDPMRIGIGGESVGGTMAAATVLQLAQAGKPVPSAAVCVYPLTTGGAVRRVDGRRRRRPAA
jgi:acetyl esterase